MGLATEEVLTEVDASILVPRGVRGIQSGDAEQFAGSLAVVGGDDRGVDPLEAESLEELVDRHCEAVPHPTHRAERVGSRAKVRDLPEVLVRMLLRRDGVGVRIIDEADDLDPRGLHLDRAWPLPRLSTTSPSTTIEQPVVRLSTSDS